jgi:hypothetical protein
MKVFFDIARFSDSEEAENKIDFSITIVLKFKWQGFIASMPRKA